MLKTFNDILQMNLLLKREEEKDKPLFLLGSGPSLNDYDISILKNCYTMSFNRSFIAFKDWGFEPTYFAGLDHVVNNDNKVEYRKLTDKSSIKRFFFSRDAMSETYLKAPNVSIVSIDELNPKTPNMNFITKLTVSNSGLFGLQVALGILKFKEIYLLGCDSNYSENIEDVKVVDGAYVSDGNKDINHFRRDYYGKGTTYNKPGALIWHLPAWKWFYDNYVKNNGNIKVYNCAKNGKLTFFEFCDLNENILKNIQFYERK